VVTTALIIAAGAGARLQEVTGCIPKPLLPLAGIPLLKRIILTARKAGIARFVIVTGHAADQFHEVLGSDPQLDGLIDWIHNDAWHQPNGVSVLAARKRIDEPFALLMADHLFEEQTLERLLQVPLKADECLLAVDGNVASVYDLDDATKVYAEEGRILEINKNLERYNAIDTGMFVCTPILFEALETARRDDGCSLSDGIQALARNGKMRVHDIGDAFWHDIDTPDMLDHAEDMLLRRLRKPTDGVVSRHLNRHISTRISKYLVRTPLTPNHVTLITFASGLLAAWFVAAGDYWSVFWGAMLFQLSSILDGCDGEVAKLTFSESKYGSWLDTITDNLTYVAFFGGVVWAYAELETSSTILTLGTASVIAVSLSILLMYYYLANTGQGGSLVRYNEAFQEHAAKPQPGLLARMLNIFRLMAKRDFFTLLLLVFAVMDHLDWMFWSVTVGGFVMALAVFLSAGRLLNQDRAAHQPELTADEAAGEGA